MARTFEILKKFNVKALRKHQENSMIDVGEDVEEYQVGIFVDGSSRVKGSRLKEHAMTNSTCCTNVVFSENEFLHSSRNEKPRT